MLYQHLYSKLESYSFNFSIEEANMKTLILIGIVAIIGGIALKSLYKMLKGESSCNCSKGKNGSCSLKDKCKH